MEYKSLNVLADKKPEFIMTDDAVSQVADMINSSNKNRNQRRRLERTLRKIDNITSHAQDHLDKSAYKEYEKRVDKNFLHFFAILGLCMMEDYNWKEDETHGQIVSLFKRMEKKINKYADMGYSTEDLIKLLDEKTGIELRTK